jgi:hypothetical protein
VSRQVTVLNFASLCSLFIYAATAFTVATCVHFALPVCASMRLCSVLIALPRFLLRFLRFYAGNLEALANAVLLPCNLKDFDSWRARLFRGL